ncbi:AN1-type zinc finger protein 1 [Hypsizygus marmoreus]|uniref:AN1-type zinc finger protein 1 n=1 Tax=Hypsizygus marmoreus TaxID=39966 RepID=A0A369JSI8_HYPMA|nr:AN1-type zinc finger protein 1 [Hypsizygus marmoreus]
MAEALLHIGAQCSHSPCKEIDFLPIICKCNKYFCKTHISPDVHQCPVDLTSNNPTNLPFVKLQRCAAERCGKPSLNAFNGGQGSVPTCSQCQRSFCADHRYPDSHSCLVQDNSTEKKSAAARALLAKNFPSSSTKKVASHSPRPTKRPTDPVKLAQYDKLELMKMRHRALPGDSKDRSSSVSLDQRLHIKVRTGEATEKVFWFQKTMVIGRVLDCLASQVGIKPSDGTPLELLKVCDDSDGQVLRNDRPIVDEVEEGDTLVVRRIALPT